MGILERSYQTAAADQVVAELMHALRPPPRLSVSEWADSHRRLPTKGAAEPGRWRTSRMPHLGEIMDCLSHDHPARRVVFMKPVQSGGTECGNNWVGSVIDTQKVPMMVVQPTLDMAEKWSKQRLASMIDDCPTLRAKIRPARERDSGNTTLVKEFPGGILLVAGANSGAGLRSMPVRYLMLDEVDAYPIEIEGEGDPMKLAEARTTTFSRRKIFVVSTPTVESLSRIAKEYEASDQRHRYVPCPACNHYQVLEWEHLHWERGHPDTARYACEECGNLIEEHHKTDMLARGEWRAEHPEREIPGFHINALYTPVGLGLSWSELAQEFEESAKDPLKRKAFDNLRLARVTKDPDEKLDHEELATRADPRRRVREVPRGVMLLTAGVDVQKDRWAVIILGWARGLRVSIVDWFELPGDPTRPQDWLALDARIAEPLTNACGVPMRIELAGVDSGYLQDDVMNFIRGRTRRGWFAAKGAKDSGRPLITRPSRVDFTWRGSTVKGGAEQWPVGVVTGKEWIFSRLTADRERLPEDRMVQFPADLGDDFYSQLTAEVYDSTKRRFVAIRPRNEALDTFVLALAAAMHPRIRVNTWREPRWQERERIYEPPHGDLFAAPPAAPAEMRAPGQPEAPQPMQKIIAPPSPPRRAWVAKW